MDIPKAAAITFCSSARAAASSWPTALAMIQYARIICRPSIEAYPVLKTAHDLPNKNLKARPSHVFRGLDRGDYSGKRY